MAMTHRWSYAVNLAKHLPMDAGRPVWFVVNGPETIIITDANKCFIYRNGDSVIRERVLWPVYADEECLPSVGAGGAV